MDTETTIHNPEHDFHLSIHDAMWFCDDCDWMKAAPDENAFSTAEDEMGSENFDRHINNMYADAGVTGYTRIPEHTYPPIGGEDSFLEAAYEERYISDLE